jgi:hypothetical protein
LTSQLGLCFLLHSFNHIEPYLHFLHAAFICLATLEYFFCDFDIILHALKDILIFIGSLILNLAEFKLLLSIGLVVDDSQLVIFVFLNREFELLHPGFEDLMGVWHVMVHLNLINQYKNLISTCCLLSRECS